MFAQGLVLTGCSTLELLGPFDPGRTRTGNPLGDEVTPHFSRRIFMRAIGTKEMPGRHWRASAGAQPFGPPPGLERSNLDQQPSNFYPTGTEKPRRERSNPL